MTKLSGIYDIAVIGGGIIGLATARRLLIRHPSLKVCVLERDYELANYQTKRNSGVVHRGVYYKKGSLKSKFCIKGAEMVKQYCQDKKLPYHEIGKLIVATQNSELETLHKLFKNAKANMVDSIEMLNKEQIQNIQPGCTKALEAIWSPKTAIVDWQKVALSYADDFIKMGGTIHTFFMAKRLMPTSGFTVITHADDIKQVQAKSIVNCAGIFSDYFARLTGNDEHPKVIPFKGRYYELSDRLSGSIKTNIYPVPDPDMPFLGVHITPRIDKSVILGPTALIALGYDRYHGRDRIRLIELYHIFIRSGLRQMLKKPINLKAGLKEFRMFVSRDYFADQVSNLMPGITEADLVDNNFCGIRAQTLSKRGELIDDFLFETGLKPEFSRVLHVRNCPSPAATSSLAIAERLVTTLEDRII